MLGLSWHSHIICGLSIYFQFYVIKFFSHTALYVCLWTSCESLSHFTYLISHILFQNALWAYLYLYKLQVSKKDIHGNTVLFFFTWFLDLKHELWHLGFCVVGLIKFAYIKLESTLYNGLKSLFMDVNHLVIQLLWEQSLM